jgi:hypothetical protein
MGKTASLANIGTIADSSLGFRNRIINGAMVIDQRNAVTTVNSPIVTYTLDRWRVDGQSADGVFTVQKSTTAPAGFTNSLLATVTTADASIGANQLYLVSQAIEGFNVADLGFGAAGAQTVTLSFWVRSSVTGTFGGTLMNGAVNYSYPFTFTISSANTFEYKTITVAGATAGTWLTDNGVGLRVWFSLGAGSTYLGTSGSWAASGYYGATGQTNLIATNGATFYLTGVQLEKGSTATSFDYRPYGTELALCQRYYYKTKSTALVTSFSVGFVESTTVANGNMVFPVSLRTSPTAIEQSGTAGDYAIRYIATDATCSAVPYFVAANVDASWFRFPVASGLTAGQAVMLRALNTSAYLAWSAEL